jgi:histone deacetylase complex regulatory component SIN3
LSSSSWCWQRLKEKDAEWKRARTTMNVHWKEELERNYPKSLDHRSFYFKQSDKRQLATRTLIAQVKDARQEVCQGVCVGRRHCGAAADQAVCRA